MVAIDLDFGVEAVVLKQYACWIASITREANELIGRCENTQAAVDLINDEAAIDHSIVRRVFVRTLIQREMGVQEVTCPLDNFVSPNGVISPSTNRTILF